MTASATGRSARTRIDAGVIVAHQDGEHRILRDGVVVVRDGSIEYVGQRYEGPVDDVIDARRMMVTPGFINTHAHLSESPLDKSFVEDVGKRQFAYSGLAEMLPARSGAIDHDARRASVDYSMAELIRTGTTTVLEIGGVGDYVAEAVERAGLRAYIANSYRSGRWFTRDGNKMEYSWEERAGLDGLQDAVEFIERVDGRAHGRIRGFLSPAQVDTCTSDLLQRTAAAAEDLQVPVTLHTSQSVFEFDAIVARHGLSPIEWLDSIGFLSDRVLLGHAIMVAGTQWVQFAGDDLGILARTGASVAHNYWVFARRGIAMESFPRYLEAGVNVCLGTDTAPQSMIDAIKGAAVIGKIMVRRADKATAADAFNAATLNAARMLHRPDLGRVGAGAKADLLFWRLDSMFMSPVRDPIKNLVYSAMPEDLAHVMVDGDMIMRDGVIPGVDQAAINERLQTAATRMWASIPKGDWAGRTADEMSPPTFGPFIDDVPGTVTLPAPVEGV